MGQPLHLVLVGAPSDTHNLGVSALHHAVLAGVLDRRPDARLTVFGNGLGQDETPVLVRGRQHSYASIGMRLSRRFHRRASLTNIRFCSRMGGLGNPAARALLDADAVLDISGGDSFSDIYGQKRFEAIVQPKELVLARRRSLVLLPQTYGPFASSANETRARSIVRNATLALARDDRSLAALCGLAGDRADDERYVRGVDVAFGLETRAPTPDHELRWRQLLTGDGPVVGLNVSGLVYNDPGASNRFGLRSPYRQSVHLLVRRLLDESDVTILLIPHVLGTSDAVESDPRASEQLRQALPNYRERIIIGPSLEDPREAKWLIGQVQWFCGTRMHATIAALSSGVPAAALAYSGKTLGVFESCDQGNAVADLRELDTEDAVDVVMNAWRRRETTQRRLTARLPHVLQVAEQQMDRIVELCQAQRDRAPQPSRRHPTGRVRR